MRCRRHRHHRKISEIALLDSAVGNSDLTGQSRPGAKDAPALDLCLDQVGIYHPAAVERGQHLAYPYTTLFLGDVSRQSAIASERMEQRHPPCASGGPVGWRGHHGFEPVQNSQRTLVTEHGAAIGDRLCLRRKCEFVDEAFHDEQAAGGADAAPPGCRNPGFDTLELDLEVGQIVKRLCGAFHCVTVHALERLRIQARYDRGTGDAMHPVDRPTVIVEDRFDTIGISGPIHVVLHILLP